MRKLIALLLLTITAAVAHAQALHDIVVKGSTDRSVTVKMLDSATGIPSTDIVFNSAGIDLWYRREGAASTDVTEATLAALTTAHTDGGFLHVNDGVYRLDLPDAAFATGANYVDFGGTVTGEIVVGGRVRLTDLSIESATVTVGTNNDKTGYALTQSFPTNFASLAITGGGAVTAGTVSDKTGYSLTQAFPTNFSAMDINGTGGVGIDWANVQSPTTTVGLSGTTISTAQQVVLSTSPTNCVPAVGCEAQGTLSGTHTANSADLGTNAPASTTEVVSKTLVVTGKTSRIVTAYNPTTGVATFAPSTALTLADSDQWYLWGTPPSPAPAADTLDTALLNCVVDTANFAGSATTLACDLTDRDGVAVTSANNKLTGLEVIVTSGAQNREKRYINSTSWDGANNELQITLDRAMPGTLADAVTAIIR